MEFLLGNVERKALARSIPACSWLIEMLFDSPLFKKGIPPLNAFSISKANFTISGRILEKK